jgi:endonuclease/exonuclease/phosphatase family metal-dependent hydrolase
MTFKVVTWNIENFSRTDDDHKANPHYPKKLEYLSARLNALLPDVVALQEVLDEGALAELARLTGLRAHSAPADDRGNRVAFLVRGEASARPILDYRLPAGATVQSFDHHAHVVSSLELRRPFLALSLEQAGRPLTVINAHLKSKLQTFPDGSHSTQDEQLRAGVALFDLSHRAAEAASLRAHVTELLTAGERVLVCGDMNDGPHAATTEILYGPPGSQLRVPEDAHREASGFSRPDQGDAQRLFNLVKLVPEARRWTRIASGVPEQLDHILCSEQLLPRKGALRTVPVVDIPNEELQSIGERPRTDSGIPDHALVSATFDL